MRRPRVKPVHLPYRTEQGAIRIGGRVYGLAVEIADPTGVVWRLLQAMDGTRTRDEIARKVADDQPGIEPDGVLGALDQLIATGFVEDAAAEQVDADTAARYSRSIGFYSFVDRTPRSSPAEVQRRIADAHVAVLGVGGVGSASAQCLAATGIGRLTIVDPDVVELSNLNRQVLYVEADLGRPKVTAAAERLVALRPDLKLEARQQAIQTLDEVVALFDEADVVVLAADTPAEIEQWANQAALRTGTPWVNGAYDGPHVCVTRYDPAEGPCWRCMRLDHYDEDPVLPLGTHLHKVTAATANLAGNLTAHVALAQITGVAPPPAGLPVIWNTAKLGHAFTTEVAKRPDCPDCAP